MADADSTTRLNAALEGRYRIERELGAGGMATVYLAEDLKHHRSVALKVLKPELAAVVGADRFLAEIETTANLQHPHILPLFDSGEADGFLFYVMPYVEGESLRERLDREHQLPLDDAVDIASDVASALDYAHSHGVIHRDVKPANILLNETGEPLVSDFGIALAVSAGGGDRLTETGLSLGTPHYMSPEQATGDLNVGPQTDVYALGCVLYEMLVGEPPYTGSTPQSVLGKIITGDVPAASDERKSVPPNVEATIAKALQKVPADRFRSVSDLIDALAEPHFRFGTRDGARGHAGQWKWATVSLAALAAGSAVLFGVLGLTGDGDATADPVMRFDMPVSTDGQMFLGGQYRDNHWGRPATNSLAISPDGTMLVYAAWTEDERGTEQSRLYVRRLEENQVYPLEGTVGAATPFFSPDGDWIGFLVGRSLRRVPSGGGTSEIIVPRVDRNPAWGATWGDDGTIVYGGTDGLYQVSANGGTPTLIAEADSLRYQQPEMLPGSDALLFHAASPSLPPERAEIRVLSLPSREHSVLFRDATNPRYLRSGHLLFMRQGTLMGVAFDAVRREVLRDPVVVLGSVMHSLFMPNVREETGAAQLDVSRAGHVVFASGGTFPGFRTEAVRVTLDGSAEVLGFDSPRFAVLRVSPDGTRVAFAALERGSYAIYVRALEGGVAARRLDTGFRGGVDGLEWSPDGEFIAYSSPRGIERLPADGTGEPELLVAASEGRLQISSWSPRGDIAYMRGDTQDWDIWIRPAAGESLPFVASDAQERYATFSPDGRWLAYQSNETGQMQVHVRPYFEPGADRIISRGSAYAPAWSPDGQSIYFYEFRDGRVILMVTDVRDNGTELSVGAPRPLIDPWPYTQTNPARSHDMLPDGSFLAAANFELRPGERTTDLFRRQRRVDRFQLILNFSDLLVQRLLR